MKIFEKYIGKKTLDINFNWMKNVFDLCFSLKTAKCKNVPNGFVKIETLNIIRYYDLKYKIKSLL